MLHTRALPLTLAIVALGACGGGTEPNDGPLKIGIVSGNNQSAPAPTAQLPDPVVGRLVRLPNGTVAWVRAVDLLLPPKAYAQSTVQGSPVPGAVVCAAPVASGLPLTPVVPCTNTGLDGTATFAFTHGTTAGVAKAVVQGMLNGTVATFDTATATVTPGPLSVFGGFPFAKDTAVQVGQVLDFNTFPLKALDHYGNVITSYTFSYQRQNKTPSLDDPTPIISRLVPVRAGDTVLVAFADTAKAGPIHLRIVP